MLNSVDFSGRPFHFIGIGGIGMSALAYVLTKRKLPVSGSDISLSHITQRLQEQGVHIFWSQEPTNLNFFCSPSPLPAEPLSPEVLPQSGVCGRDVALQAEADFLPQVICSTAINTSNAEYRAALDLGCPIFHRSDLLAALMHDYRGIAIAGTHGKTTTSSMIGYLLLKAGLDPTIIVGGEVNAWNGNAHLGEGPYLVAEADESDGSLVKLAAQIGIVTNIELDHPDHYTSLEQVVDTFKTFAQNCQTVVGCTDCATVRDQLRPSITYGLAAEWNPDYTADDIIYNAEGTTAQIWEKGRLLGRLTLKLLGPHNLTNALAAIATGRLLGLEFAAIAPILATFEGARRRFEHRGLVNGMLFVDDYAHHPSEIRVTLAAARLYASPPYPYRRVVAVFQAHRYSRTIAFLSEFATSFAHADVVVTTDIYSAGEVRPEKMTGETIANAIAAHHSQVSYQPTLPDVSAYLRQILQPGDLVIFLGAGNLNRLIPDLIAYYHQLDQDKAS